MASRSLDVRIMSAKAWAIVGAVRSSRRGSTVAFSPPTICRTFELTSHQWLPRLPLPQTLNLEMDLYGVVALGGSGQVIDRTLKMGLNICLERCSKGELSSSAGMRSKAERRLRADRSANPP